MRPAGPWLFSGLETGWYPSASGPVPAQLAMRAVWSFVPGSLNPQGPRNNNWSIIGASLRGAANERLVR